MCQACIVLAHSEACGCINHAPRHASCWSSRVCGHASLLAALLELRSEGEGAESATVLRSFRDVAELQLLRRLRGEHDARPAGFAGPGELHGNAGRVLHGPQHLGCHKVLVEQVYHRFSIRNLRKDAEAVHPKDGKGTLRLGSQRSAGTGAGCCGRPHVGCSSCALARPFRKRSTTWNPGFIVSTPITTRAWWWS